MFPIRIFRNNIVKFRGLHCSPKKQDPSSLPVPSYDRYSPFGGKIQYLSDLHLDYEYWKNNDVAPSLPVVAPILIIAGDLGRFGTKIFDRFIQNVCSDFDKVIFVPGNHEFYGYEYHTVMNKMKFMEAKHPRLKVLLGSYQNDPHSNQELEYGKNLTFDSTVLLDLNASQSGANHWDNRKVLHKGMVADESHLVRIIGTPLWSFIPQDPAIIAEMSRRVPNYTKIDYYDSAEDRVRLLTPYDTNSIHLREVDWLQQVFWNSKVEEFTEDIVKYRNVTLNGVRVDDWNEVFNNKNVSNLVVSHHTPLVEECCDARFLPKLAADHAGSKHHNEVIDRTRWCNWAFSSRLDWLVKELEPKAWIFGHTHLSTVFEYSWECGVSGFNKKTIMASNPVGRSRDGVFKQVDRRFVRVL